jgi:hypothetical protein
MVMKVRCRAKVTPSKFMVFNFSTFINGIRIHRNFKAEVTYFKQNQGDASIKPSELKRINHVIVAKVLFNKRKNNKGGG